MLKVRVFGDHIVSCFYSSVFNLAYIQQTSLTVTMEAQINCSICDGIKLLQNEIVSSEMSHRTNMNHLHERETILQNISTMQKYNVTKSFNDKIKRPVCDTFKMLVTSVHV